MTSKIKYENSPPPSDFEYEDIPFFTLSRPQNIYIEGFLSVDYSLIHPRLLGLEREENLNRIIENKTKKTGHEDANKDVDKNTNEKMKKLSATLNKKSDVITVTNQYTTNMEINKKRKRPPREAESQSKMQDNSTDELQKRKHVSVRMKRQKCHRPHQSKRVISSIDSDESVQGTNVQDLRYKLISNRSKKYMASQKDSDCSKLNLRKRSTMCRYKKKIPLYDNYQSSNSDRSSKALDYYSRKTKQYRSISSDEEQSLSYKKNDIFFHTSPDRRSCLRNSVFSVKQEVFSDYDKISYFGKFEGLEIDRFSESDEGRNSKWFSPKREEIQEIEHEPMDCKDNKKFHGPDVYYCSFCKLTLNSDLTWKSHLLGQRHAKAIRAQSVHEVARSSLLNASTTTYNPIFEDGPLHNRPPSGMKRVELKGIFASIQEVCDDLQYRQLIIGMRHVWEIKGEVETSFYCNLCDAPCGASSIMPHLTGFKHRVQCLKEYFPQLYDRCKDDPKRKIENVMEDKFSQHRRFFRKEKIRVFQDVPISDYKKSYRQDQSGLSWQTDFRSQTRNETVIVKDDNGNPVVPSNQEILDTKYADFHCIVCDSHMNNIAMWEAHIRGKRHLKNMKKDTQGVAATNKYVLAPPGTVSNLVKQIEKVCTSGEIIVGLKYIRENRGRNGNIYNCFPCGGCCSDIDIVDHILSMKHKIKYLEKMDVDGFKNSITEINNIQISNIFREQMVDAECQKMVCNFGRGKPKVYYIKRDLKFG